MPKPGVVVAKEPMTLDQLLAVADGARLELGEAAVSSIERSRAVVDSVLASGTPAYGLNLGLGHMKDTRLPDAQLVELQEAMVEGHAGAIGPPHPARVVRAAMAARVNGIARGGAGASLACAETYAAMLNAGVHPVVPSFGSVGASDLAQMAAIARVAIGRGSAELHGEVMPGGEALRRAGIPPLKLQPKDGLALMSANGIAVGHGAIVAARARSVLEQAGLVAVLSLEARSGNSTPFDAVVAQAKGVRGQARVSDHVRALLRGSALLEDDPARSVQDALSFRVVPQVHGAAWEFVRLACEATEVELNAMTDNPLVSAGEGRIVSNGNFHPMMLALSFDALRPALAHVAQLSDRRMNHLWAAIFARPGEANRSVWGSSAGHRGTSLRYAGAAAAAAVRQLAGPATLDVVPLDLGIEDHATGAPLSVIRADELMDWLEQVLGVELLMAHDLLAMRAAEARVGAGASALMRAVDGELVELEAATDSVEFHAAAVRVMRRGPEAMGDARLSWAG